MIKGTACPSKLAEPDGPDKRSRRGVGFVQNPNEKIIHAPIPQKMTLDPAIMQMFGLYMHPL